MIFYIRLDIINRKAENNDLKKYSAEMNQIFTKFCKRLSIFFQGWLQNFLALTIRCNTICKNQFIQKLATKSYFKGEFTKKRHFLTWLNTIWRKWINILQNFVHDFCYCPRWFTKCSEARCLIKKTANEYYKAYIWIAPQKTIFH